MTCLGPAWGFEMQERLQHWFYLIGITITQGVINTLIAGAWWVVTGRGKAPDPDEAFSSRVGRYAAEGQSWALLAERIIDGIFGEGHCRTSAEHHAKRCEM